MNAIKTASYTRIHGSTARRLFEAGQIIYLVPCRVNPASPWACPAGYRKKTGSARTWAELVNSYTYYNCNTETGRYPAYYIEN